MRSAKVSFFIRIALKRLNEFIGSNGRRMQRGKFYDVPGGDTMLLDLVDPEENYRLPTFRLPEGQRMAMLHGIKDIQCREDDIILNAYPKTGTNWLWEMLTLIYRRQSIVVDEEKMSAMLEAQSLEETESLPPPRILNTHLLPKYLPRSVTERKTKQLLICRNPKDVLVSFYNHATGFKLYEYDGKFENYFKMFVNGDVDYGSYAKYLLSWQQYIKETPDAPVLVLYFEDLKMNGFEEMKKVCQFLEQDIDDALLSAIVDSCRFGKMKQGKKMVASEKTKEMLERITKNDYNLLRKGQVGDWKHWFTVAQNEEFDTWWDREAKDLEMFQFRYC